MTPRDWSLEYVRFVYDTTNVGVENGKAMLFIVLYVYIFGTNIKMA